MSDATSHHTTNRPKAAAQPPATFTGIELGQPPASAAGWTAVQNMIRHLRAEMGMVKGLQLLRRMNQHGGFDCPGCAWPDPEKRSSLGEYCENGGKAFAEEATIKHLDAEFFQKHSVTELATWSDYDIGKSGRLTQPMVLKEGSEYYEPISWEAAFGMIADHLNQLTAPNEAIFYTSGRTSNEAAFLYQLFVRHFGTNNLPDCSNMCHESSGKALSETLGIGKGSVRLSDFYETDLILVIGQNPGTNHPRMLSALQKAKEHGARIISINPLFEAGLKKFKNPQEVSGMLGGGTPLADMHLPVRINGDVALFKGILKLMWDKESQSPGSVFDHAFIKTHTEGYDAFIDEIKQVEVAQMVKDSGITLAQMQETVDWIIASEKIIICWAMGLTQHKNAVDNIREVVNLLLLKGSIGRPGAGTCPVRGHSNVQGDRTMGIWEIAQPAFMDALQKEFGFDPPRNTGYNTVDAIKAMHDGKAKVMFCLGGNFISAAPDTEYTATALRNCELTVQVSTKLNRSHLVTGKQALILPCLGRTEIDRQESGVQFQTVENSMGVVHTTQGIMDPASAHLLSEPAIVARLAATTLGAKSKVDWLQLITNYDLIRDHIEHTIPGFDQYNQRVREKGGFELPNGARVGNYRTKSGKAHFTINALPDITLQEGEYLMMTIRSHDQYNTTIYGLDDRYRGIYNERRVVLMNEEDMQQAGLQAKTVVDLVGNYEGQQRIAHQFLAIPYDIPTGCVATYFPEANVLVPVNNIARESHTPASKSIVIRIVKHA